MLVMTRWYDGLCCLSVLADTSLILKIDQSQNDFGQRQVLIPASVIDIH